MFGDVSQLQLVQTMISGLKINIEPKNQPIEKENHVPNLVCLGSMLIFIRVG